MMTFGEYQKFVDKTATYPARGFNDYPLYGLVSEVGELFGKLKRYMRGEYAPAQETRRAELLEFGDILWYLTDAAALRGFTLEEVAAGNIEKLTSRHARGVEFGEGDDR